MCEIQNKLGGEKFSEERMREEGVSPGLKEAHLNKTKDLGGGLLEHNLNFSSCCKDLDQLMHNGAMMSFYEDLGAWGMLPGNMAEILNF